MRVMNTETGYRSPRESPCPGLPGVAGSILDTIGRTPLVRLSRLADPSGAAVLAKLESRNPGGSIKDRIALSMVEQAEAEGKLKPGMAIVEPTSGNTGIGLAIIGAVKGYKVILTMPEDMSPERRKLFEWLGARVSLTPAIEGMSGAVFAAEELAREHGYFMPQQFTNSANPAVHRQTTAVEILEATGGQIDAFVAGVGTGGTVTGVGEVLKKHIPNLTVVAVEPTRSAVLSGERPGRTRIQGLGAGFIPGVLNRHVIDQVITVGDQDAEETAHRLARQEGILCGFSSGAAVRAALAVAKKLTPDKTVVVILPDTGERYLSL